MQIIDWNESLSVEIEEIDADHRKLIELYGLLGRSVQAGKPYDFIEAVLQELIACTIYHFRHEERLMLTYDYADIDAHKEEHHELIKSVRSFFGEFQRRQTLSNDDIAFLENWLTQHILGHDMKLGFYLMKVM